MTIQALIDAMTDIAPLHLAESWDNVGLLLGDATAAMTGPVLLTIDLTESVCDEAVRAGASAIIAYHPPIFEPLKRIDAAAAKGRVLLKAARAGIAIFSPHTALDAAPGALSDWLADGLLGDPARAGGADRRALRPFAAVPETEEVKIVTFVPEKNVEQLRAALASSGAGLIGNYSVCSFAHKGTGSFLGKKGTHPAVGKPEQMEYVEEVRLEMVCSHRALPLAMTALRQFHPYEEPPMDIYPLAPRPVRGAGSGRRLVLDQPATLSMLATRLKAYLGLKFVQVAAATDRPVTHIGLCAGAGASVAEAARAEGCQVFVTGEMKHHEVLGAIQKGLSIILAGHTATERGYLPVLARRLGESLPGPRFMVSQADRDPLEAM